MVETSEISLSYLAACMKGAGHSLGAGTQTIASMTCSAESAKVALSNDICRLSQEQKRSPATILNIARTRPTPTVQLSLVSPLLLCIGGAGS